MRSCTARFVKKLSIVRSFNHNGHCPVYDILMPNMPRPLGGEKETRSLTLSWTPADAVLTLKEVERRFPNVEIIQYRPEGNGCTTDGERLIRFDIEPSKDGRLGVITVTQLIRLLQWREDLLWDWTAPAGFDLRVTLLASRRSRYSHDGTLFSMDAAR